MLIERGYYRRNVLLYQLLRENIFASAFCMGGNKSGKTSSDLLPLYLDRYKTGDDTVLTYLVSDKDVTFSDGKAMIGTESYPIYVSKGSVV